MTLSLPLNAKPVAAVAALAWTALVAPIHLQAEAA